MVKGSVRKTCTLESSILSGSIFLIVKQRYASDNLFYSNQRIENKMAHPYWFGIKVEFTCQICGITSIEKDAINSTTEDFSKLQAKIGSQPHRCQNCGNPTPDGADVDVLIHPDSRESLFRLGYAVPELPGDR
jgi:hypothetical protein